MDDLVYVYKDNFINTELKKKDTLISLIDLPKDREIRGNSNYYKNIEIITNNLIQKYLNISPELRENFLKNLIFIESIYVEKTLIEDNLVNNVYIEEININNTINCCGTFKYMDPMKSKAFILYNNNKLEKIYSQEFALNLGKLVYYLLNGYFYKNNVQLYQNNYPKVFQKFFFLIINYKDIENINQIERLKLEYIKEDDDELNQSSYTSINQSSLFNSKESKEYISTKDLNYLNYYGLGFINSSFCILSKKKRKEIEKESKDLTYENFELPNDINEEIENIFEKYKGVI
jgi:hypothetical protein